MALQFIRESLRVSRIYWITPFTAFGGVIREMVEQGFRVNVCFPTLNESGGANDPSWDEFRSISPLVRVQSLRDLHPEPWHDHPGAPFGTAQDESLGGKSFECGGGMRRGPQDDANEPKVQHGQDIVSEQQVPYLSHGHPHFGSRVRQRLDPVAGADVRLLR